MFKKLYRLKVKIVIEFKSIKCNRKRNVKGSNLNVKLK